MPVTPQTEKSTAPTGGGNQAQDEIQADHDAQVDGVDAHCGAGDGREDGTGQNRGNFL